MKKSVKIMSIILALSVLFGILSAGCSFVYDIDDDPENNIPDPKKEKRMIENSKLDTFSSDEELLEYVKEHFEFYYYTVTTDNMIVEEAVAMPDYSTAVNNGWIPADGAREDESTAGLYNEPASNFESDKDLYSLDEEIFVDPENPYPKEESEISETNLVDVNVDEGDIVKTDGEYIYILRENELIIVSAKGVNTEVLSYYKIFSRGEGSANEMYIKDDVAIIVGNTWHLGSTENNFGKPVNGDSSDFSLPHRTNYTTFSAVYIIDISNREKPVESSVTLIEGDLISSRESNGKIYLVANKYLSFYGNDPVIDDITPYLYDAENGFYNIPATQIVRPVFENVNSNIMTVAFVDYKNGGKTESVSVLGSGSDIYMTAESLYIFGDNYSSTDVAKYSVGDSLEYVASVSVPGYTATDFSYNEYNGEFRIATTTNTKIGTENNVYVYNGNLEKIGELTGLAPSERIYSVRFSGDVAYVVTFRQVDPLFVIDMSENDPKVLGELKIPGFSTYLHPVGDGLLLGIGNETKDRVYTDYNGYEHVSTYTAGIKISLFDVSDPYSPKEISVANMVGGENANAEALYNHKAFTYSKLENTGYFAIDANGANGFVCVSVDNGELSCKLVFPENEGYYGYNSYNSRVCFINGTLYFYQYNRITVFDRETCEEIATVTIK